MIMTMLSSPQVTLLQSSRRARGGVVVHDVAARQAMDKVADLDVELGALHDRLPGGRQCGAELVPPSGHGRVGVITPRVMATLASACSYPR
jgi:hypothetical protein